MFVSIEAKYEHQWPGAYYTLPTNPTIPPLRIAPMLYYASAFESGTYSLESLLILFHQSISLEQLYLVMSVMENAAIAGRNAALLLLRDVLPNEKGPAPNVHMTFQPTAPPKKSEL